MTGGPSVWFHAVSVGEILSSVELIRRLRAQRPYLAVHVSTTTLAGRAAAEQRLSGIASSVFYAPLDYRSTVRRVLRRLRPALVVVMETEIWPNLYREAKRAGASLVVVNARISDRALPRYQRWNAFFRHVLAWPDAILAQTEEDRRRYLTAGAPAARVRIGGNLKYDFQPPGGVPAEVAAFLDALRPEAVWIAASTMPPAEPSDPDEDDAVIRAFHEVSEKSRSLLLLILVPRRPERFDAAADKLARAGVPFVRRSALSAGSRLDLPGVLLLDTVGELAPLFGRATVVFMGGTLAHRGGHNILEPAWFGKPVIAGPHMENFAEIDREFSVQGGVVRIGNAAALAGAVAALLNDPQRCAAIGGKARELALAKRGVVDSIAGELLDAAAKGVPDPSRTLPARALLTPLSWIWSAGHTANLRRGLAAQRALAAKVISVGGLSMGGVGKSPMVAHLAAKLFEAGQSPAILTRGYRRRSAQRVVIVPRGGKASVDTTGDEAQIFVRAGLAHVGIGADRFATGKRMEQDLQPGVFLLDDGFQHVRLKRDEDIVLIDGLDPLGGGMFPLGRRREPLESLSRATAIVVTRLHPGQEIDGIEACIRKYNQRAPIFCSRVVAREWVDLEWDTASKPHAAEFHRVAAFCGLGAPHSFWHTLRELGLEMVFAWPFGDHHHYRPAELERLARQAAAAGAEAVVTTEKDVMNLFPGAGGILAPLRLYWLRIAVEIDNEQELLQRLL
jgi:tetraacyldisaccharide 4'-kinase